MLKDLKEHARKTATLYFDGFQRERPYELSRSFDPDLAQDLSLSSENRAPVLLKIRPIAGNDSHPKGKSCLSSQK